MASWSLNKFNIVAVRHLLSVWSLATSCVLPRSLKLRCRFIDNRFWRWSTTLRLLTSHLHLAHKVAMIAESFLFWLLHAGFDFSNLIVLVRSNECFIKLRYRHWQVVALSCVNICDCWGLFFHVWICLYRSVVTVEQTQRRFRCTCRTTASCPWNCQGICCSDLL